MDTQAISRILEETAVLLDLKMENYFKVLAYRRAAEIVGSLTEDIETLIESGKLSEIKGIGEHLADKIREIYITGKLSYLNELKKTVPSGLVEMLKIPGLGPRKIHALYEKLNIKTVSELEKACRQNNLSKIEGFGEKSQKNILKGIEYIKQFSGYYHLDTALSKAQALTDYLKQNKDFSNIDIAGSLRRSKELIHDIDIVASGKNHKQLLEFFSKFPETDEIIEQGGTKSSIRLASGINADIRVVDTEVYPYALMHFTGSKEHNTSMRSRAKDMGFKLNEYGLFKNETNIPCSSEEDIFRALKLSYIPPELRENSGEIEAAQKGEIPQLIKREDIKGTLHVHSNYSDAKDSLETLIKTAIDMHLEYIGITEHSESAFYAGGLKETDILRQHAEIDELSKKYFRRITILKGIESDINPDGSIDYTPKILKQFDFVIGSIHSRFNMPERDMTNRLIKALKNPYLTILGHPTGRMLLAREGYPVNLKDIINAASKYKKIIELNSNPYRFDLDWRFLKFAKEKGVLISINPDAHAAEKIKDMYYGVGIARKGWLEKKNVLNTMTAEEIIAFLKSRKPV